MTKQLFVGGVRTELGLEVECWNLLVAGLNFLHGTSQESDTQGEDWDLGSFMSLKDKLQMLETA